MKRILFTILVIGIFSAALMAGTVTHTLFIPRPQIEALDTGHKITLAQAMTTGEVGNPGLPVWGLSLLLPPGEEAVSVRVETGNPISLGTGYQIPPVQRQYPLSFKGPVEYDRPNPAVYDADAPFPQNRAGDFRTDFYRGYGLAAAALNPVSFNPVTGELAYYPNMTVTVTTASTARSVEAYSRMLKRDSATRAKLETKVENPAEIIAYGAAAQNLDEPYFDILLITSANYITAWADYIGWKTRCGYYVAVETVQDIYTNYTGIDNPEKIRNCVIDYYNTYDIDYVFLGGDDEILPHRGFYVNAGSYSDSDIPADLYFSNLDGNWNTDGDDRWGEPGEDDLLAEVNISRAAVDSPTEIANFVNKQMMYQRTPVVNEVQTALMAGEDLGWPIWAWEYKEEVRTGNSSWGFQTAPFPSHFAVDTLYERPGYYWSGIGDLVPRLNQGPIYVNHLGHANVSTMMQLNSSQVNTGNMTNNGVNHNFYLVYSQGCYCGSFDNRTTGGSHQADDCITEYFSVMATGAVAMVTNSRYGWGDNTSTRGSSQYYDKQFFDAIWGENITIASDANRDSKEDCIPYINLDLNRWCFYQVNLFAEPALDLWTAAPTQMAVNHASSVILGSASFQVQVSWIEGARVCLSKDGTIHGLGFTDNGGNCTLILSTPILSLGNADLYVTYHDRLPYEGTVTVTPPSGPFVIFNNVTVADQNGNNNGQWDYSETVNLDMALENVGVAAATGVSATITTEDTLVTIIVDSAVFGNIAQGDTTTLQAAFRVQAAGSVENGHWVPFILTAYSNGSDWTSYFNLQVFAPDMKFYNLSVDDSQGGNGNRCLDPGETAALIVGLLNDGGCFTTGLQTNLSTQDPYITITSSTFNNGTVNSGAVSEGEFTVRVSLSCPLERRVNFDLAFGDQLGYTGRDGFSAVVSDRTFLPAGPDNYGYSAYDCNDYPEFTVFDWVEISADSGGPGARVQFTQDDQVFQFPLPFTFQYYGLTYDTISIATNGWLGMGVITQEDYSNSAIPDADGPAPMIAPMWEDLSPQRTNSGGVWYWSDAANHRYIVEFNHVEQYRPYGAFETFQTILYDPAYHPTSTGDGQILMQYKDISNTAIGAEGTYGIEDHTETDGIQYLFDGSLNSHASPFGNGSAILYTTPALGPNLTLVFTPANPPIVIPPQGGSFSYTADVTNNGGSQVSYDAWIMVTLPSGQQYGPVLNRPVTMPAGGHFARNLNQSVPGFAPSGSYTYTGYCGDYSTSTVYAQDSFDFSKSGVDAASPFDNWNLAGWDGENPLTAGNLPEEFKLRQNYPNPFNPVTHIQFDLPETRKVRLEVFNTLGQSVAVLVDGEESPGFKTILVDASAWSSGIYFYKLEAGDFKDIRKMILLK